jgi:hypothetical protein
MLTRVKEMIDEFNSRPNSSAGFTAKEVFNIGQTYGLTCREIYHTFLGKRNSVGYGRYLPQMPPAEVIAAAMANGPKKRGRKPGAAKKANDKAIAPRAAKKVKDVIEAKVEETASQVDENPSGEVFCWIATPQEINEDFSSNAEKPKRKKTKSL